MMQPLRLLRALPSATAGSCTRSSVRTAWQSSAAVFRMPLSTEAAGSSPSASSKAPPAPPTSRLQVKVPLTLTDSAAARLRELLNKNSEAAGIRLGVRKRGCSGNSYVMDYATEKAKFDEEVVAKGVRVFVNPQALMKIVGTEMDYVEDELRSEFVFRNPNSKGQCGCGESFHV